MLQQEFIFLCLSKLHLLLQILPSGSFIKPLRLILRAADGGCKKAARNRLHSPMKRMGGKKVRIADFILTVGGSGDAADQIIRLFLR